mmetsp:Transcript_18360/g.42991  ORF Transcript_18360/g.42991 Transcript_18360/m.42991 type:complete len:220 (+) Transcript_18360:34-693(+)
MAAAMRSKVARASLRTSARGLMPVSAKAGITFGKSAASRFGASTSKPSMMSLKSSIADFCVCHFLSAMPSSKDVDSILRPVLPKTPTTVLATVEPVRLTSLDASEQLARRFGMMDKTYGSKLRPRFVARASMQRRAPRRLGAASFDASPNISLIHSITPSFFTEPTPLACTQAAIPSAAPLATASSLHVLRSFIKPSHTSFGSSSSAFTSCVSDFAAAT